MRLIVFALLLASLAGCRSLATHCTDGAHSDFAMEPTCPSPEVKPDVEYRTKDTCVQAPRARVCIPRSALAQTGSIQAVETAVQQNVMLVPQRVLVPYVQTNQINTLRLSGTQATQVAAAFGTTLQTDGTTFAAGQTNQQAQTQGVETDVRAQSASEQLLIAELEKALKKLQSFQARIEELEKNKAAPNK